MRFVKLLCCSALLFPCVLHAAQKQLDTCLEQGKKEFSLQHYAQAETAFKQCLALDPTDEETLLSLGGVYLTQDKLDAARESFLAALKQMKRTSPYLSYTYSMLGDIALKQNQHKEALAYYNRSLVYNEAYTNSLVGKGVITEELGDKKAAAEIYKTALAVEPLNVVARQHLVALEPVYFTDEEMLEALKQRTAVDPGKNTLSEQDRALFLKLHSAEQRGAVDYLREKFQYIPSKYVVTLYQGSSFAREMLTPAGYDMLQKRLGQDAILLFQKSGVSLKDVFELRDLKGEKIFLPDNTLTEKGIAIYNEALQGRRMFVLPNEDLPLTREQMEKIANDAQELKAKGYTEISPRELRALKSATNCSEDTLRRDLGLYVLKISPRKKRYFVVSGEKADERKGLSWHYIARMRAKTDPFVKVPENRIVSSYEGINYTVCSAVDGEFLE